MIRQAAMVMTGALCLAALACGRQRPQELPVVVSPAADTGTLQWRDAHGPLRGEVPWVLRTDLLGPDTYLVVETAEGDRCARKVVFDVLAGGETKYTVTLANDLRGRVKWRVTSPSGKRMKLFTCTPRPAEDPRQECLKGGIPKPLLGELVGDISAELVGGTLEEGVQAVRFERAFPCAAASPDPDGENEPLSQ
jgi:hypothetical protein